MNTICVSTIRELLYTEIREAARVLGRGMCNNPANLRAFGIRNSERRCCTLERFFTPVLQGLYHRGLIFGAFRDSALVGVCGMARPGPASASRKRWKNCAWFLPWLWAIQSARLCGS